MRLWWKAFRRRWFERPIGVRDLWCEQQRDRRAYLKALKRLGLTEHDIRRRDPAMTERDFQQQVVKLAAVYGWRLIYHTHDSRHSASGFPDLVMLRPPEAIFVELKAERGRVSEAQAEWLSALTACGLEAHLWTPADFDTLHARLRRRVEQAAA